MVTLIKMKENQYLVTCPVDNVFVKGSQDRAVEILRDLDIEDDEIEVAFSELDDNGHNRAHFGVNNCFTYSEEVEGAA
jgi:hypothetical protein